MLFEDKGARKKERENYICDGKCGKAERIREILKDLNREIVTMREAGFEGEIEENGTTFRENAEIKAKAVWEKTGGIVLADDSDW